VTARSRPMFDDLQYRILKTISHGAPGVTSPYAGKSKLAVLMGEDFFRRIAGKVVIDFGCGQGVDSVEIAARGASRVIGVDIREDMLEAGREEAVRRGVQDRCIFTKSPAEQADFVISVDAFEHFADPAAILNTMSGLLRPGGQVLLSFGPTWYHPMGGHLFSLFPWAHLVFSEKSLIRWRSTFRNDGATRFGEVAGGLNQMTIDRFEELIANSPFRVAALELVPIRRLKPLHNRLTREFTTAVVRCSLNLR
jgi:SAM-dependent methyltransferase